MTASASETSVGSPVAFSVNAYESHAPGALTYQISYGDGATDQNTAPAICQGGSELPASQNWQLSHAYSQSNIYTVTVTVVANCTSDHTTNSLTITIG